MTNAAKRRGSGSSWAELWAIYRLETSCVLYQGVSKYRIPGDRKLSKGFRILAGAQARWYLSNPDPNSDFSRASKCFNLTTPAHIYGFDSQAKLNQRVHDPANRTGDPCTCLISKNTEY